MATRGKLGGKVGGSWEEAQEGLRGGVMAERGGSVPWGVAHKGCDLHGFRLKL